MTERHLRVAGAVALIAASATLWQAWAAGPVIVTQRNRAFHPDAVSIGPGGVVRIVNDDGELLHHAYVKQPELRFDSGEQEPGSHVDVAFPRRGTYRVLCGIHPKMRLVVTVH